MTDAATNMRLKLPIICFVLEIILIILFGVLVQYDHETDAKEWHNQTHPDYDNDFYYRYASECLVEDVWKFRERGSEVIARVKGQDSLTPNTNM